MKAPDKIYARITAGDLDARLTPGTMFGEPYPEYIRKDTLMEWLNNRISDGDEEGLMTNQIANLAYKDVIEKLNSL